MKVNLKTLKPAGQAVTAGFLLYAGKWSWDRFGEPVANRVADKVIEVTGKVVKSIGDVFKSSEENKAGKKKAA